jgi:hypothetical protein
LIAIRDSQLTVRTQADTTEFQKNITASGILHTDIPFTNVDDKIRNLINKLVDAQKGKNLKDVYEIYMWNYCSGTKDNGTSGGVKLDYCSPRKAQFWFDPVEVWGLNGTGITNLLPSEFNKGLSLYHKASTWMFVAYTLSFWVTAASIVVGIFAICSRWGSCATSIVASVCSRLLIVMWIIWINGILTSPLGRNTLHLPRRPNVDNCLLHFNRRLQLRPQTLRNPPHSGHKDDVFRLACLCLFPRRLPFLDNLHLLLQRKE